MELKKTAELMLSDNYKERFVAEYHQTKIRYDKLNKGIEVLKNEIEQIKQTVDGLTEVEHQANKLFLEGLLEGLLHALSFIES